jgi:hypothetical protein
MLGVLTSSAWYYVGTNITVQMLPTPDQNIAMGFALPADLSKSLEDSCPCRLVQLRQLTSLFSVSREKPVTKLPIK